MMSDADKKSEGGEDSNSKLRSPSPTKDINLKRASGTSSLGFDTNKDENMNVEEDELEAELEG